MAQRDGLVRPPVPPGGVLSEGDKRDSKGDMPVVSQLVKFLRPTCSRQRLLCSGASISDSAEEDLVYCHSSPFLPREECRWVGLTLGEEDVVLRAGLVASLGNRCRTCRAVFKALPRSNRFGVGGCLVVSTGEAGVGFCPTGDDS